MNSPDDKPNFLQPSTLIAFGVLIVAWFAWTQYLNTKYPNMHDQPVAQAPATPGTETKTNDSAAAQTTAANAPTVSVPVEAPTSESTKAFADDTWAFDISSRGMALKKVYLKKYQSRSNEPIRMAEAEQGTFGTYLAGASQPIDFVVEQTAANQFVGRADVPGARITKTVTVNSAKYTLDTEVKVEATSSEFKGLSTELADVLPDSGGGSIFNPSYDFLSWFVRHSEKVTRHHIVKTDASDTVESNVGIASLSAHYFALAIVDHSSVAPKFSSQLAANAPIADGALTYTPASAGQSLDLKYTAFAGPKSYDLLKTIDDHLPLVIDFGMFAIFARPILWLLKFLNEIIGNWGFAIIALTIIVRVIVLPFNAYSYKSMKVMQKLQPEMTRIREKYKDKPPEQKMQMNQEVMELMKRHKANPVGGCLPMLLQLPVFFALYQVLGQSIELYQAPFIFWIQDLTLKDHFYVLPILMGASMFVQQKITPSTMDPQQAKIMMWMPVIFSFMMVSLPSGLTLYIFVSTLFGIIQQYLMMRDSSPKQSVTEAKA